MKMVQNIYHLEQHGENHTLGIHYPKKESSQKKKKLSNWSILNALNTWKKQIYKRV